MEEARKADREHIGPPAIYAVILHDRGLWRFDPNSPLLQEWTVEYKDQSTAMLESEYNKMQVLSRLYKWEGHDGSRASDFSKSTE